MTQDEELFGSSGSSIVIHYENDRIFTDIFEDEIFLVSSHPIDGDIQTGNPELLSVDLIVVHVFVGSRMIVSLDDSESFVGKEHRIDSSGSAADSSAFYARHSSHDSETGNRIAFPIFDSRIIMDLIHKRQLLLGIQDSHIADIPIGDGDIVLSPGSIIVYSCPVRTHDISQIFEILLAFEQIYLLQLFDIIFAQGKSISGKID